MVKYFMGDTCLADWERMMMDSSRKPDTAQKESRKKPSRSRPPYLRERELKEDGV